MQTKINLKKENFTEINLQDNDSINIFAFLSLKKNENFDGEISLVHFGKNSKSRISVRIVLSENSFARFFGKVKIEKGAKKSDSNLDIKVLLLSDSSKILTEPIIEVFENDVENAGHGLAISGIPKKELQFLMTRGISEKNAKKLVKNGFLKNNRTY